MTHYQKLATLFLRLVSAVLISMALMGLAWRALAQAMGTTASRDLDDRMLGSVWYLLLGIVLLALSKPIARLLARGLE